MANSGRTGWQRQTFMIRFRNGTGELDAANRSLCLVINPVAAQEFRSQAPYSTYRFDKAAVFSGICSASARCKEPDGIRTAGPDQSAR